MQIKPFSRLVPAERQALFGHLAALGPAAPFPSLEAMAGAFHSPVYEGGHNMLTLWTGQGEPAGCLGVILREAQVRREVFLTSLYAAEAGAAETVPLLVQAARHLVAERPHVPSGVAMRLGVRDGFSYLHPAVQQAGFAPCYRMIDLSRLTGGEELPPGPLTFVPMCEENLADFAAVNNAAFLTAPNGATTDVAELRELLAEQGAPDWRQVGYEGERPVAMVEVAVHEGYGMIEAIGVAPGYQGRGYGEATLNQAMRTLRAHGVPELRLGVAESNQRAYALYTKRGFTYYRTISQWFELSPLPRG